MRGCITTKHLVIKAPTIITEFGMLAYIRCWFLAVFSRRKVTFLDCVTRIQS